MNAGWRGPSRLWNYHCLQQTGSQTSMYPTSHLKSASQAAVNQLRQELMDG